MASDLKCAARTHVSHVWRRIICIYPHGSADGLDPIKWPCKRARAALLTCSSYWNAEVHFLQQAGAVRLIFICRTLWILNWALAFFQRSPQQSISPWCANLGALLHAHRLKIYRGCAIVVNYINCSCLAGRAIKVSAIFPWAEIHSTFQWSAIQLCLCADSCSL